MEAGLPYSVANNTETLTTHDVMRTISCVIQLTQGRFIATNTVKPTLGLHCHKR